MKILFKNISPLHHLPLLFFVLGATAACEKKGFRGANDQSKQQPAPDLPEPVRCSDQDKLISKDQTLFFKKTSELGCDDVQPGPADTVLDLREQKESIQIPAGAQICDIELSASGFFNYEDFMLMTLNDYVFMASNHPESEMAHMKTDTGLYRYQRADVVHTFPLSFAVNDRETPQYCAQNDPPCRLPKTASQGGEMSIQMDKHFIQKIPETDTYQVGLIVMGQGQSSGAAVKDCGHTGLILHAKVVYEQ